ncbi:Alpha/Beta hydrolase protein [Xylaria sp. FL1777]|nr:Alpha/Beta hydrolase protein [Xylaria sp. FL1777]
MYQSSYSVTMADTRQPPGLFFTSINPSAEVTIVFLHGLFCSHLEFNLVLPHLKDYHLLLVDLPSHSRSHASHSGPFTLANCAARVANLILTHANNARAHIVGVSGGGFVGMHLATQHPELVTSLFVSGATPFQGYQRWLATHPQALYPLLAATTTWPSDYLYRWVTTRMGLLAHEELHAESKANFSFELVKLGYSQLAGFTLEDSIPSLAEAGVRTLVLAGEVVDDARTAKSMGRLLRENGSPESEAVLVKGAQHLWDLQFPLLFAESIKAWVERRVLPDGLKKLS